MSPSMRWSRSYQEALKEELTHSSHPELLRERIDHLRDYLSYLRALAKGRIDGVVPQVTYWLIENGEYLGELCIRLKRSGRHPTVASNVYFQIRPSMRNRGYGTQLLVLGLSKARSLGLNEVLASVNERNLASRRIIEKCGGVLKKKVLVPGENAVTNLFAFGLGSDHRQMSCPSRRNASPK